MDKTKLMADASKIITQNLLKHFKAEIEQLGHDSNSTCDCNCEQCRGEHKHMWQQLVPNIKGCYLGDLDDHRVFAVDADKVMLFCYPDFVVAGNPERYDFIPSGQFWVDHCFVDKTTSDYRHDLLHEAVEARLMKSWGKDSYDDRAHPAANEFELAYMRELGLDREPEKSATEEPKPKVGIIVGRMPWELSVPAKARL